MPVWACFSYSADVPPNVTSRGAAQRAPRGPGRMPGYPCFAYPSDTPQAVSGPRRMPLPCFSYPYLCFSYPDDAPLGNGNRDGAQPTSPELRSMPYPCFRY
jgi:hypothetical protein